MFKSGLIAALAFMALAANAEWKQEPTTFLGIPLGAPLTADVLPACSMSPTDVSFCITGPVTGTRVLRGVPLPGVSGGTVLVSDGAVYAIALSFSSLRFEDLKAVFLEKYGAPTQEDSREVRNGMGVTLASRELDWKGERVSIRMLERKGRIDTGLVYVVLNSAASDAIKRRDADIKGAASRL